MNFLLEISGNKRDTRGYQGAVSYNRLFPKRFQMYVSNTKTDSQSEFALK
jgi:hypothetical protein